MAWAAGVDVPGYDGAGGGGRPQPRARAGRRGSPRPARLSASRPAARGRTVRVAWTSSDGAYLVRVVRDRSSASARRSRERVGDRAPPLLGRRATRSRRPPERPCRSCSHPRGHIAHLSARHLVHALGRNASMTSRWANAWRHRGGPGAKRDLHQVTRLEATPSMPRRGAPDGASTRAGTPCCPALRLRRRAVVPAPPTGATAPHAVEDRLAWRRRVVESCSTTRCQRVLVPCSSGRPLQQARQTRTDGGSRAVRGSPSARPPSLAIAKTGSGRRHASKGVENPAMLPRRCAWVNAAEGAPAAARRTWHHGPRAARAQPPDQDIPGLGTRDPLPPRARTTKRRHGARAISRSAALASPSRRRKCQHAGPTAGEHRVDRTHPRAAARRCATQQRVRGGTSSAHSPSIGPCRRWGGQTVGTLPPAAPTLMRSAAPRSPATGRQPAS